jgi:hypothetical protein
MVAEAFEWWESKVGQTMDTFTVPDDKQRVFPSRCSAVASIPSLLECRSLADRLDSSHHHRDEFQFLRAHLRASSYDVIGLARRPGRLLVTLLLAVVCR